MNCVICKQGKTEPGHAIVTLQRAACTVIIKDVPAQICDNCGEYYLDEAPTAAVLARAEAAVEKGAEVEILRYAA